MRIVVTGGAGHLGSYLVESLSKKSEIEELLIIDCVKNGEFGSLLRQENPRKRKVWIKSIEDLSLHEIDYLKNYDCILHFAAETNLAKTTGSLDDFRKLNLKPTLKIVQVAHECKIPIIFPSSTSVYDQSGSNLIESISINKPTTAYAQCKLEEEQVLGKFFESGGLGTILRLGTIHGYSPGMKFHTAINKMIIEAVKMEEISIWRTALKQIRPYLSLRDLGNAIELILDKKIFHGETYNLATAHYSVEEIVKIIEEFCPTAIKIKYVDSPAMNEISFTVSGEKLQRIGFQIQGSLRKDLLEFYYRLGI